MSVKYHISPETGRPNICKADKKPCPLGADKPHFETKAAAREYYEKTQSANVITTLKKESKNTSVNQVLLEKKQRKDNLSDENKIRIKDLNDKITSRLAERAKITVEIKSLTEDLTFDDANPVRAERRLNEAIDYAKARRNNYLFSKLENAKVLPSGAFKFADGTRFNTDKVLRNKVITDDWAEQRSQTLHAISKILDKENVTELNPIKIVTEDATFSAKHKIGFNEKNYESLPQEVRDRIEVPVDSLNLEKAREVLPAELVEQIETESLVFDYIQGKTPRLEEDYYPNKEFSGNTPQEKAESAIKNISEAYGKLVEDYGHPRDLEELNKLQTNAIKKSINVENSNVFVPGRSQLNGAVIHKRKSINFAKANELLTPEQIKAISVKTQKPDAEKAKQILSKEQWNNIFNSNQISLTIRKKAKK